MLVRSEAKTQDELCTCQQHIVLQAASCTRVAHVAKLHRYLSTLCLDLIPLCVCKILYLIQDTVQCRMSLQLLRYVYMIDLLT